MPSAPRRGARTLAHANRWRRCAIRIACAVGAVIAAAGIIALVQLRLGAVEARQLRAAESREALADDLVDLRRELATSARTGRAAAAANRVLIGRSILGWDADRDANAILDGLERRSAALRDAGGELVAAAQAQVPTRSGALPGDVVDPIFDQLDTLDDQAVDVAASLIEVADDVSETGVKAHALTSEAHRFIRATEELPERDEPEALAASLRKERERLEPYEAAAKAATEDPTLAPLGELHLDLITTLEDFVDTSVKALDDGEVQRYEQLRAELPNSIDTTVDELAEVAPSIADSAVADLERAEERALGLLHEIDELRRMSRPRLASAVDGS